MEISTPIRPPDDFLSKINNEVFIFEYDGSRQTLVVHNLSIQLIIVQIDLMVLTILTMT